MKRILAVITMMAASFLLATASPGEENNKPNGMIELVVAVCMIDRPSQCRDVYLNFEADNVTPQQCMMYGQMEMAKWIGDHPGYRIVKWRCGRAGQMAKI